MYLFDVLLLGARAFKNGLSMILESKHILKVSSVNRLEILFSYSDDNYHNSCVDCTFCTGHS